MTSETLKEIFFSGLPPEKQINTERLVRPPTNNFLGRGGEAKVTYYKLKDEENPDITTDVAVKSLSTKDITAQSLRTSCLKKEAIILNELTHVFILKFVGSCCNEERVGIILQYHKFGSLDGFLQNVSPQNEIFDNLEQTSDVESFKKQRKIAIKESWIWPLKRQLVYEVADGLAYLHQNNIIHLDIKAANVLVSDQLHAQISDFGCSLEMSDSTINDCLELTGLTYTHAAPELLGTDRSIVDFKCDVFSYGMFLWELLTEKTPYENHPILEVVSKEEAKNIYEKFISKEGLRPNLDLLPDESYAEIIEKCWDITPCNRPSSADLKQQLWFGLKDESFQKALIHCHKVYEEQSETCQSRQSGYYDISSRVSMITGTSSFKPLARLHQHGPPHQMKITTSNYLSVDQAKRELPRVAQPENTFNDQDEEDSDDQLLLGSQKINDNLEVNVNANNINCLKRRNRIIISATVILSLIILSNVVLFDVKYFLECPPCTTGPSCQYTTSWHVLKNFIVDEVENSFTANYAGHFISCISKSYGGLSSHFNCNCEDVSSGVSAKCHNYKNSECEHALAALIRLMVDGGYYPEPCDPSSLATGCT